MLKKLNSFDALPPEYTDDELSQIDIEFKRLNGKLNIIAAHTRQCWDFLIVILVDT